MGTTRKWLRIGFLIGSLVYFFTAHAQEPDVLQRPVSLHAQALSLEKCLFQLEQKTGYTFSYNSDHFSLDSPVTLSMSNQPLSAVLHALLGKDVQYSVIGNTIVLRNKQLSTPTKKYKYDITGVVYDRFTGEKIEEVSIYQVDGKHAALSSTGGHYAITVSATDAYVELGYSHENYLDTVIIVQPTKAGVLQVPLTPSRIHAVDLRDVQPIPSVNHRSIDSSTLVKIMVPKRQRRLLENIPLVGTPQPVQLSFLPAIGTNLSLNAAMENKVSVNILAGYSSAVDGVEVGGVLNMVRNNVSGAQMAGVGNLVGGSINGVQAAGMFNMVKGSVVGGQIAGFVNSAMDSVSGVQASGFANIAKGNVQGAQVSGYVNIAAKKVTGGGQMSGFANVALDSVDYVQLAGYANYARHVTGIQVSGFLNIAKSVHGVQFGVINIADTVKGASIGLFSFVRKGYHPVQIGMNDYAYFAQLKTGTRAFYNIFEAGMGRPSFNYWHYAYGFGHSFALAKKRSYADLELTCGVVNPENGFNTIFNLLPKLNISFSYRLLGPLYIYAGPSFNTLLYDVGFVTPFDNTSMKVTTGSSGNITFESWWGYQVGLRI